MIKRRILAACVGLALVDSGLGVEAQAQSVQYTYDALGRLSSVTRSQGQAATYSYDAAGNRTLVQTTGTPSPPPTALAVSLSATSWTGTYGSQNGVQALVTGGTAPYTYRWERVSGSGVYAFFPNGRTTTWEYDGGTVKPGYWRCVVIDLAGNQAVSNNVYVSFTI